MLNTTKILLTASLLVLATDANAGYTIKLTDNDTITFGGYLKADFRYVNGDVNSITNDYWVGLGNVGNISRTKFSVNETRFTTKYVHGDVTGYIEMDFYGGGGNEIVSNSSHPRIRQAFVKYKNILVGQAWSTFVNTSAFAEGVNFGGALNASAFIRQGQIRYTMGGFQVALENPESDKGDASQDSVPDFTTKYTFKGDWGNVSIAGLGRQLNTVSGNSKSAFGYGIAGRIKAFGKDDFRFQLHGGNTGRYVGVVAARDLVGEKVEKTTSYLIAYRHFWTKDIRSNIFYGKTTTDVANAERTLIAVNIFKSYTPQLSFGLEIGNFEMADKNVNSNYVQMSAKFVL
ncbi:MAG: hypothetical protein COB35_05885 [Gammaproteobacteria bacterium]|nr:MAG: hypothetical protein COB35_05885 [Gammaproteobacteria bacterium]